MKLSKAKNIPRLKIIERPKLEYANTPSPPTLNEPR